MAAVPIHKRQAARLSRLGISQRTLEGVLNVAHASIGRYLTTGQLSRQMAASEFPGRLGRYIKRRETEMKRGIQREPVRVMPMSGRFGKLQMKLHQVAKITGIDRDVLSRGIFGGVWPDEAMRTTVEQWIDKTIDEQEGKIMITKVTLPEETLGYWGLKRDPFTNEMEGGDDIFDSKELGRAEKKIMTAIDKGGWVAVTGPVGSGKSTLLKKVDARLVKRRDVVVVRPRIIEKQCLGASHVCDAILHDLGTGSMLTRRTLEHKARLVGRTLEEASREGKRVVLIIDEAHLLATDALLALKRIYEFEVGFKKLLSIVLVGQTRLANLLKQNFDLAEVSQRVELFEIGSLNGTLGSYVSHKLERAGLNGGREIFDTSAIKEMQRRADTPLAVNNLAAACLLTAWDTGEKRVDANTVRGIPGIF